ncbi:unnamed protein product [Lota lota]
MSTQAEGQGPEEASEHLGPCQATSLKELKQRGDERRRGGHSQEEETVGGGGGGGGGAADRSGQKRWRVQQLEKDKLDMIAAHNHEVSGLQAVVMGLRAELERGEVERQSLEYQLALSHRRTDRETDRSATVTAHNHTLRERVLQLEQRVSEVEETLRAREQDQHALLQEVSEAERLKKMAQSQNLRLTQETQQLHTLLKEKEEALQEVKRRMQEAERQRENENEALRELTGKLHLLQGREEESRRQEEQWILRIRCLESNIEAERAAHIEAKVRVQALEGEAAVARSGQQEALSDLQLLRSQFREVERAINTTHTVDMLEKQYQQFKSDLNVALETERKATSDLVDRLEEEKRKHAHTHSLLEQSSKKQVYLEEVYVSYTTQIRKTLDQHNNTGRCVIAKQEVNDNSCAEVLEHLTETLNNYHQNLDTATQQVQDLLCASEKLDEENQALRALISEQRQHNQELETILSSQKQEVIRLQQESSDWSKWSQDFKGQLEQSRLALEREREERKMEGERVREERKMEGERVREERKMEEERVREERKMEVEREREERKIEVQKITDLYHKETKKSLSFLYHLYQHLLVGCEPPQSIMGNFTWAELCDVITQRVDRLTLDLRNANDKQRLSCCQLQCSSLTSDLGEVQGVLEGERRAGAGLLAACALLAGVLLESQRRCASLRHQKGVLLLRGPRVEAREQLEEEELLSNTGPSHQEMESAANRGLSHLLDALLHQSDELDTRELSLASRLGRGLARLQASTQRSSRGVVEKLQQHFLVFSHRLHSAEVERRALRLEVANQKQAAKGHQDCGHQVRLSSNQ